MGRKTFTLRLNEEQHEFLDKISNELGITKNDYIRDLIQIQMEGEGEYLTSKEYSEEMRRIYEMLENLETRVDNLTEKN